MCTKNKSSNKKIILLITVIVCVSVFGLIWISYGHGSVLRDLYNSHKIQNQHREFADELNAFTEFYSLNPINDADIVVTRYSRPDNADAYIAFRGVGSLSESIEIMDLIERYIESHEDDVLSNDCDYRVFMINDQLVIEYHYDCERKCTSVDLYTEFLPLTLPTSFTGEIYSAANTVTVHFSDSVSDEKVQILESYYPEAEIICVKN